MLNEHYCQCGHSREDHISSGDPKPICTRCPCAQFISIVPCGNHDPYYYGWDGKLTDRGFCEKCGTAVRGSQPVTSIDTYRQHVAARQLYIDKCAVARNELDSMDQQAIECIVRDSIDQDLSRIDAVLSYVMDTLESDGNKLHRRRKAFEMIQDLYEPDQLMGLYANSRPNEPDDTPTHIDGSDSGSSNSDSDPVNSANLYQP